MHDLFSLCLKNIHLRFDSKIFIQNDGLPMGSILQLVLANVFKVESETAVIPNINSKVCL